MIVYEYISYYPIWYMIYIYIYIYISYIYISLSLQKLRQYNKNLTKHQTKINTAIITNQLKLQKN